MDAFGYVIAALVGVIGATFGAELAALAADACTLGTPDGTTCAEALVLLGYP